MTNSKKTNPYAERRLDADDDRPKILLLHGPNLNMLGRRDQKTYGSFTLKDVEHHSKIQAAALGYQLFCFQSNHEGFLIDKIHETMDFCQGILINAGALTHYSYALRDAIELCPQPVIEVHISDIYRREKFRHKSVIREVCAGQVAGFGFDSYRIALEQLDKIIKLKGAKDHDSSRSKGKAGGQGPATGPIKK